MSAQPMSGVQHGGAARSGGGGGGKRRRPNNKAPPGPVNVEAERSCVEATMQAVKASGGSMRVSDLAQTVSRAVGVETYKAGTAGRGSFTKFLMGHKVIRVSNETATLAGHGSPSKAAQPPGFQQPFQGQPTFQQQQQFGQQQQFQQQAPPPQQQFQQAPPTNANQVASVHASARAGSGILSSGVKFSSLSINANTQRAIQEVLKYEFMTPVQAETLPVCLAGTDVIAKAKTGTGKTIGFLLPSIENILKRGDGGRMIHVLVMSPTRELAKQIAVECEKLTTFHKGMSTMCVVGGTNMKSEARAMSARAPTVLVATPGRLQDHLDNTPAAGRLLSGINTLCLDECDQLVDMGFWPSIKKILGYLPPPASRQTLLYSATMGPRVIEAAKTTMRPGFRVVDTVGEEVSTADAVAQTVVVAPLEAIPAAIVQACLGYRQQPGHKVMVFFTTARQTQWASELMAALGMPVHEIHSRKSQPQREKVSKLFRNDREGIMFSSDVSARGMDYPDVTHVVQVGAPSNKEQYVHRLGRTARAGKSGECLLLLSPMEESFLRVARDLPIKRVAYQPSQQADQMAAQGRMRVDPKTSQQAYQAWLGYYNGCNFAKMGKAQLVATANEWALVMGLPGPPKMEKKTVGKMGLKGVPGLNLA